MRNSNIKTETIIKYIILTSIFVVGILALANELLHPHTTF